MSRETISSAYKAAATSRHKSRSPASNPRTVNSFILERLKTINMISSADKALWESSNQTNPDWPTIFKWRRDTSHEPWFGGVIQSNNATLTNHEQRDVRETSKHDRIAPGTIIECQVLRSRWLWIINMYFQFSQTKVDTLLDIILYYLFTFFWRVCIKIIKLKLN